MTDWEPSPGSREAEGVLPALQNSTCPSGFGGVFRSVSTRGWGWGGVSLCPGTPDTLPRGQGCVIPH